MSRLGRVKKLDKQLGEREFKLLIVEKVEGQDLYTQWDNKDKTYTSNDLDKLIEYHALPQDEQIKARAKEIEQKLFGTTKD